MSSAMRGQGSRPSLDRIDTSAGKSSGLSEGPYDDEETVRALVK